MVVSVDLISFKDFCSYLLKSFHKLNDFNGHSFGSYITHHRIHYDNLNDFLHSCPVWDRSKDFSSNNLCLAIPLFFKSLKPNCIRNSIYELLQLICDKNPNFNGKGVVSKLSLKDLKDLFAKAKGNYTTPTISENNVIPDTATNQQSNNKDDQQSTVANNDNLDNVNNNKDDFVSDDMVFAILDKIKLNYKRLFTKKNHKTKLN